MLGEEQTKEDNGGTHDYNELYLYKKQSKQKNKLQKPKPVCLNET